MRIGAEKGNARRRDENRSRRRGLNPWRQRRDGEAENELIRADRIRIPDA